MEDFKNSINVEGENVCGCRMVEKIKINKRVSTFIREMRVDAML